MARKLFCSMFVMMIGVTFVAAETFTGNITKAGDGKVTVQKMKKGDKKGETVPDGDAKEYKVAKDCVVAEAKGFGKKAEKGDDIKDGLKNELFSKEKLGEKGKAARITTNDDGDITEILVFGKKKKAAAE